MEHCRVLAAASDMHVFYDPAFARGALSNTATVHLSISVCPMPIAQKWCILVGYGYYRTPIGNPMLEVEHTGHCDMPILK